MPIAPAQTEVTTTKPVDMPSSDKLRCQKVSSSAAARWRESVAAFYDANASHEPSRLTRYYRRRIAARLAHIVAPESRVLEVGCGNGDLLAALKPAIGVGIDASSVVVGDARRRHPGLRFHQMFGEDIGGLNDSFDYIVLCHMLGETYDLRAMFEALQSVCHSRTRLIVVHDSRVWQPALRLAEALRIKRSGPVQNWLPSDEAKNLLELGGFETVSEFGLNLAPLNVPVVSSFVNRVLGNLPIVHHFGLNYVTVARSVDPQVIARDRPKSVSVVIPARNEAGHIDELLARIPRIAPRQEIIFVEGRSTDDTWECICRAVESYDGPFDVVCLQQDGKGKGDAVRKGFAQATGDVLMILDADISVPPEELPAFYDALASGRGEFINGSRMVYPMADGAMRFLNVLGNKMFGWLFTCLLRQRFRDTLCGTKVLSRHDYDVVAKNRSYFGDFDPFGDFDLLFGAARLNLKIVDMPVHYEARTYGETNISRFRHGLILLRMCLFAARKIRFI